MQEPTETEKKTLVCFKADGMLDGQSDPTKEDGIVITGTGLWIEPGVILVLKGPILIKPLELA